MNLFLTLEWIFDRLAHEESFKYFSYDEHPLRIYTINFIQRHLEPSYTVLDLGSGYGDMSNKIAKSCKKVVGVDYVYGDIEIAKSKHSRKNLEFVYGDAFDYLNETEELFDVIILSHIIEHIDNPNDFLKKCIPHTKEIFIEVPDYDKTYLNHYRSILNNKLNYADTDHVWEFDREELTKLITEVGLEIVESEFRFGVMKFWCHTPV
ncbi:MAG: methyltransferase domain-containing protein [Vicingus serpentipes]|nr:methyltransferase domain-containing protein [Vicingus serpentipes]